MNNFFNKNRMLVTAAMVLLFFIYIYLSYAKLAFQEQSKFTAKTPTVERGSIVDRNGKPLAVQTNFYHYGITPKAIKSDDVSTFAFEVSSLLGLDAVDVYDSIMKNKSSSFMYLKKKLTQEQYDDLYSLLQNDGYLSFSRFDRIPGRVYPENDLASQLIGYMGDDGKGLSGIEYSQQNILSPMVTDIAAGDLFGDNIYLTIDADLQHKLEKIAKDTMASTQAECMMLIASSVKTGAILSYISLPSANLNEYSSAATEERIDRPAMTAYEPGSVFKIFTSASYMDSGRLDADKIFLCDGVYERETNLGEHIRISCLEHHGWVNVRDALKYSCNDALAQMSDLLDTQTFLSYIHKFGFGKRTGVELPAEATGQVKDEGDKYWSARTKPTMSIGQELSVNALQMVQAASVIANGGVSVKPTVISKITDKNGNEKYTLTPEYGEQVIKASTARYILSCMETTAQSGTGHRANLRDISIGVKTGTAQMADPVNGGYSETDFVSNCLAIFPVEMPEIILYIVIEKAKGETYAGRIVAPVIALAADEIIDHLGMNRQGAVGVEHSGTISIMENPPIVLEDSVPSFIGRPKRDLVPLLDNPKINYQINGEGWVVSQYPPEGTPVSEGMTIELYLE
ncbi:MAG: transpeptidase family protein [Treponema sp.]|nr:transpeptidase family protein [Treponema sp.]